jgi:Flp pilus assembly protein TadD
MSMTLTLTDAAWASARSLATAGRRADALAILTPLLSRPDLSPTFAAKAHRLAAGLHRDADRYGKARKHLKAAAKLEPGNADTRAELAACCEDDPYGCDRRAARWYRSALKLDSTNADYRAGLARSLARTGKDRAAKKHLLAAVETAPTSISVLTVAVEACREMKKSQLAWRLVCKARFLAPADAAIRQLWQRAKFDLAAGRQRTSGARVLPFVRLVGEDGRSVRRDFGSVAGPHVGKLRVRG